MKPTVLEMNNPGKGRGKQGRGKGESGAKGDGGGEREEGEGEQRGRGGKGRAGEKSILTGHHEAKDKKNYTQILLIQLVKVFLTGYRLVILKVLYVCNRTEQICKQNVDIENLVSHCQRKK